MTLSIKQFIQNSERLLSCYNYWPSFHDAEMLDLHLWRGDIKPGEWVDSNVFPVLTVKLLILGAVQSAPEAPDVQATIRFHSVDGIKMEDFNHVNQIVGLSITTKERGTYTDGTPLAPYLVVSFEKGFGISCSLNCSHIEILDATPITAA